MSAKVKNLLRVGLAAALLVGAILACCPTPAAGAVSVTINSPSHGATVALGQSVMIDSTVTAAAGVDRVDLTVGGVVVRHDVPPSGNPTAFRVSQPWTPESEGQATISVVGYDVDGASGQASITLQVVASGGVVPTDGPGTVVPPAPEPTETPPPPVTTEAGCTLNSQYVADVTVPDGTVMSPGAGFVKTWKVKNSGTCDWEAGFQLVFVSGDQMSGPASAALPAVAAGAETDISVNLTAPTTYGTHKGTWRIRSTDGTVFGTNLTVVIVVPAPATDTPLPTDVPTGAPTDTPKPTSFVVVTLEPPAVSLVPLLPDTQQVYKQVSIDPGDADYATASCPSGSIAVSGGYSAHPDVLVYSHFRYSNGWRAYGKNNGGVAKTLSAYAVCLFNVPGASVTQHSKQVTAPANGVGHPIKTCPAGSIVTGGGWAAYSDGSLHVYNSTKSGNGWQMYARNLTGSDKPVKVYAVCMAGTTGTTSQVGNGGSVPGSGTGGVVATCGGDSLAVGGGFAGGATLFIYNTSAKQSTNNKWNVYAKNTAGSQKSLNAYAVCLSFP